MSSRQSCDLKHVAFLLAELAAELDALEAGCEAVQALAQLDEREARGEPLTAVCGKTLRASLEREIAASPITQGRRKLAEFSAIFERRQHATNPTVARETAEPVDAPAPSADIIDLDAHRAQSKKTEKPIHNRTRLIRGRTLMSALALLAMAGASVHYLPALSRGGSIDIAANVPLAASGVTHWASLDGF